ncbi:hypothetical protein Cpin_3162 [Chitinophaga pinensis DSM 2588]|uniref:Uncharacterized protein n=1 Tax=Chitinophaga pinensis (strain ATCC 43595 / DSM 2588 / LMG 13176 / NBRC 15968 / NCIMB 11800 / UQM 2034) TaxID=485918 RepID=A0A979G4C5_CHIPD|nr:hypothetical protein Cpin_3162 [Chitinophaga pinensis DSM 2588]
MASLVVNGRLMSNFPNEEAGFHTVLMFRAKNYKKSSNSNSAI